MPGVLQYLNGNVVWELFVALGGTHTRWQRACAQLMHMVEISARRLGVEKPFNTLTGKMIRVSTTQKPKLKLKAAEGRHFLPVLIDMVRTFFPVDTEHAQTRLHCLEALQACYREMIEWNPQTSPSSLGQHCRRHLLLWAALKEATDDPWLWCFYPKHHLLLHAAEQSTTNPMLEWNYADESEIGAAVLVAKGCNVNHIATSLPQHYRSQFELP